MTTINIRSDKFGINETRQINWATHRDLNTGEKSVEALVHVGDLRLEFVKGGWLSETGSDIALVAVRDEEGIIVSDADIQFSLI